MRALRGGGSSTGTTVKRSSRGVSHGLRAREVELLEPVPLSRGRLARAHLLEELLVLGVPPADAGAPGDVNRPAVGAPPERVRVLSEVAMDRLPFPNVQPVRNWIAPTAHMSVSTTATTSSSCERGPISRSAIRAAWIPSATPGHMCRGTR